CRRTGPGRAHGRRRQRPESGEGDPLPDVLLGHERVRERLVQRAVVRLVRGVGPVALILHLEYIPSEIGPEKPRTIAPGERGDVACGLMRADADWEEE